MGVMVGGQPRSRRPCPDTTATPTGAGRVIVLAGVMPPLPGDMRVTCPELATDDNTAIDTHSEDYGKDRPVVLAGAVGGKRSGVSACGIGISDSAGAP